MFEDTMFWTDRAANKVSRCNKYTCEDKDVIGLKMEKPLGIVINHPVRQPNGGYTYYHMSCVARKTVFRVSEPVRHKMTCTVTEES